MTESIGWYVSVGRGEVDVGVFRIINTTAFAVRIVGSGEFFEVASTPRVDAENHNERYQGQEDYEAYYIGAFAMLCLIVRGVPGTMGSRLKPLLLFSPSAICYYNKLAICKTNVFQYM